MSSRAPSPKRLILFSLMLAALVIVSIEFLLQTF